TFDNNRSDWKNWVIARTLGTYRSAGTVGLLKSGSIWLLDSDAHRPKLIEQLLGFDQVLRAETFGEPAVDRGEKIMGIPEIRPWSRIRRARLLLARSSNSFAS